MLWSQRKSLVENKESAQVTNQPNIDYSGSTNANQTTSSVSSNTMDSTNPSNGAVNDRDRLPEIFQKYNESHNIPIEFYGRFIDQDSNPVPGVKIRIAIQQTYMTSPTSLSFGSKMIRMEKQSELDGNFVLQGEKGDGFKIEVIEKDGYKLSPSTQLNYGYVGNAAPFHPDPQNPVVFKMWKLDKPQQLISHDISRIAIPVDGQPVQFDLIGGNKVSSGGQLIVRFERNPQTLPPGNSGYDWKATFEIPDGGLVANNDEFMYQAPENGYKNTYTVEMPNGTTNWTPVLDQKFYIQLENGKSFGSLNVHLPTFHNTPPLGLTLDVVINPSGSRNLQP